MQITITPEILENLIKSDGFIQVNKSLIIKFGWTKAILLGELLKERSYWRSEDKLKIEIVNGKKQEWFYSSHENIRKRVLIKRDSQIANFKSLKSLGIIDIKSMGMPAVNYYMINDEALAKSLNSTVVVEDDGMPSYTTTPCSSIPRRHGVVEDNSSNINIKDNKEIDSNKSTGSGALAKHPRNFSKQTLSDDLESGKDIDEQKKVSKKSPKDKFRDECLDIIDDEYSEKNYSYTVKDLLVEYFEFVSAVPDNKDNLCKRVKTAKAWKNKLVRLDELVKDGYDPLAIIQQSLDKKQYVFYPLQNESKKFSKRGGETLESSIVTTNVEEAQKLWDEAIKSGEGEYC